MIEFIATSSVLKYAVCSLLFAVALVFCVGLACVFVCRQVGNGVFDREVDISVALGDEPEGSKQFEKEM